MNILSKWTAKGRMTAVLMFGAVIAFASGCRELDPPAISVDPQMVRIGAEAVNLPLRVMSNTEWTAENTPAWVTLSRSEGRGSYDITVFVEDYDGLVTEGRQATITFKTKDGSDLATYTINQGKSNARLIVTPPSYEIGNAGGPVSMSITSNTSWTIEGVIPAPDGWAVPNATSGSGDKTVVFTVAPNTTGVDREVTFYVITKAGTDQIIEPFTITQFAVPDPTLILAQTDIFFDAIVVAPGKASIFVPFVTSVTDNPICSASKSWCTAVVETQNGVKGVKVTVTDNDQSVDPRECIVTVIAVVDGKSVSKQINVLQAGSASPELVILRPVITIPAKDPAVANGSVTFTIGYYTTGTTAVTLVQDWAEWITSATLDAVNKKITVVAKENYGDFRTTGISLTATGGGKTIDRTVTINQLAADAISFKLSSYTKSVPASTATPPIKIEFFAFSNIPGTVVVAAPLQTWITNIVITDVTSTMPAYVGTIKKITADIAANTAADSRQGAIEVIGAYGTQTPVPLTMDIHQAGEGAPDAVLSRNAITVPAAAGGPYNIAMTVNTGTVATPTADVTWITDLAYAGGIVSFKATANPSATERYGIITITVTSGGKTQFLFVDVTQLGTGSAELDIYQEVWNISAAHHAFDVPIIPIGTTEWEVVSYSPVPMFAVVPVDTDQAKLPLSINENKSTQPRTATVVLLATNGDSSIFYTVTVNQEGVEAPNLRPVATEVHLGAAATAPDGEFVVPFLGYDPTVTFLPLYFTDASMFNTADTKIVTSGNDAYLQINVKANSGAAERNSIIRIVAQRGGENQIFEVKVYQAGVGAPLLIFPTSTFYYGPEALAATKIFFENPNGATIIVKNNPAWITGAAGNSDNISFAVTENATSKTLSDQIVIEATTGGSNKALYTVNVVQAGLTPIGASLAAANLGVQWSEGVADNKIVINNLPDGTLAADIVPNIDVTWLTLGAPVVSGNVATITMTVPAGGANPKTSPRNAYATIVVTRGTESQTLGATITQEAAPAPMAQLSTAEYRLPADLPGVAPFNYALPFYNVNSNTTFGTVEISNPAVVSAASVSAGGVLGFTAAGDNASSEEREAILTIPVTAGGETVLVQLRVVQNGLGAPDITIVPASFEFGPAGQVGASLYVVNPNGAAVTIAGTPTWVTNVLPAAATSAQTAVFTFDVAEQVSSADRSGVIVVQATLGGKTVNYPIGIAHKGLGALGVSLTQYFAMVDAPAAANVRTVNLLNMPAGASWTAVSNDTGWLTVGTTGANSFPITVTENTTGADRFGSVYVEVTRGTGVTQEKQYLIYYVVQKAAAAPAIAVNPTSLAFAATDAAAVGVRTVNLIGTLTNLTFLVQAPNWLTVTQVAAGGTSFTVVPAAINTGAAKTGDVVTLTVTGADGQQQFITIPVTQAAVVAPTLKLSQSAVQFNAYDTAASSLDVQILDYVNLATMVYSVEMSNTNFTVSRVDEVITINPVGDNITTSNLTGTVTVKVVDTTTNLSATQTIGVTQTGLSTTGVKLVATTVNIGPGVLTSFAPYIENPNNAVITITNATGDMFEIQTYPAQTVNVSVNNTTVPRVGFVYFTSELNGIVEAYVARIEQAAGTVPPYTSSSTVIAWGAGNQPGTITLSSVPMGATIAVASYDPRLTAIPTVSGNLVSVSAPENLDGSIKVYHVTLAITYLGTTNYLTVTINQAARPNPSPMVIGNGSFSTFSGTSGIVTLNINWNGVPPTSITSITYVGATPGAGGGSATFGAPVVNIAGGTITVPVSGASALKTYTLTFTVISGNQTVTETANITISLF